MTPEQEILEDALIAARQRSDSFRRERRTHAASLPIGVDVDRRDPSDDLQTEMAAFAKRYEMTQDLIVRRLFRSVLAVRGVKTRSGTLAQVVDAMAQLGIIDDLKLWEEITKLRNRFAHDYALTFKQIVPLLNEAWGHAPVLIEIVDRTEHFVAEHRLLEAPETHD